MAKFPSTACLGLIVIAFVPPNAHGRVGETLKECKARYGNPDAPAGGDEERNMVRFTQGLDIEVWCYFDGKGEDAKCERMRVGRGLGQSLDLREIEKILDANKGDSTWEGPHPVKPSVGETKAMVWKTRGGEKFARGNWGIAGGLTIETKELVEREKDREKREASDREKKQREALNNF